MNTIQFPKKQFMAYCILTFGHGFFLVRMKAVNIDINLLLNKQYRAFAEFNVVMGLN